MARVMAGPYLRHGILSNAIADKMVGKLPGEPRFDDYGKALKERAEEVIRESNVDWTIVRPGALRNKLLTGQYRAGPEATKKRLFPRVGRADVADFMLDTLEHNRYVHETPAIFY